MTSVCGNYNNGCPCRKDCPDRVVEPNCHGHCERYLAWKQDHDKKKEAERVQKMNRYPMSEAKVRSMWKTKRYSRQVRYNKGTKAD